MKRNRTPLTPLGWTVLILSVLAIALAVILQ